MFFSYLQYFSKYYEVIFSTFPLHSYCTLIAEMTLYIYSERNFDGSDTTVQIPWFRSDGSDPTVPIRRFRSDGTDPINGSDPTVPIWRFRSHGSDPTVPTVPIWQFRSDSSDLRSEPWGRNPTVPIWRYRSDRSDLTIPIRRFRSDSYDPTVAIRRFRSDSSDPTVQIRQYRSDGTDPDPREESGIWPRIWSGFTWRIRDLISDRAWKNKFKLLKFKMTSYGRSIWQVRIDSW